MDENMFISKKGRRPSSKTPLMYQARKRQLYKHLSLNMDALIYLEKLKMVQNNEPLKKRENKETSKSKDFILEINHSRQYPQTLGHPSRAEWKHHLQCSCLQSSSRVENSQQQDGV